MNPLKKWRNKEGCTQQELADILGTSREAVSKWELGQAIPRAHMLLQIAQVTGIRPERLLADFERHVAIG